MTSSTRNQIVSYLNIKICGHDSSKSWKGVAARVATESMGAERPIRLPTYKEMAFIINIYNCKGIGGWINPIFSELGFWTSDMIDNFGDSSSSRIICTINWAGEIKKDYLRDADNYWGTNIAVYIKDL